MCIYRSKDGCGIQVRVRGYRSRRRTRRRLRNAGAVLSKRRGKRIRPGTSNSRALPPLPFLRPRRGKCLLFALVQMARLATAVGLARRGRGQADGETRCWRGIMVRARGRAAVAPSELIVLEQRFEIR